MAVCGSCADTTFTRRDPTSRLGAQGVAHPKYQRAHEMSGLDCRHAFHARGSNLRVRRETHPFSEASLVEHESCSTALRNLDSRSANPTIFPWSPRDGVYRRVERGGGVPGSNARCGRDRRGVDPRISGGPCRPACPGRSRRALERRSGDRRDQGPRSIPTDGSHARPRYGAHPLAARRPVEQQSHAGNRARGRPSPSGLDLVAGAGNAGDKSAAPERRRSISPRSS